MGLSNELQLYKSILFIYLFLQFVGLKDTSVFSKPKHNSMAERHATKWKTFKTDLNHFRKFTSLCKAQGNEKKKCSISDFRGFSQASGFRLTRSTRLLETILFWRGTPTSLKHYNWHELNPITKLKQHTRAEGLSFF